MSFTRFLCQTCHQPLKRTPSMETSGLGLGQEPAASTPPSAQREPGETREEGSTSRTETDVENLQDGAWGWTLIGDGEVSRCGPSNFTLLGQLAPGGTLSSIQEAAQGIFDILSGEEAPAQPLCEDCTDGLLRQLDSQLRISESDARTYQRCLETADGAREAERETLQGELEAVGLEEARLVQELEEVEKRRERAAAALEAAGAETQALEQRERQGLRELGELQGRQLELQEALGSLENRLRYAQAQLAWLQRTSAFQAAFDIREDGPLAIINGFRLGCVPAVPVSWQEINAAWGQTALLLAALANAVGLQFRRYRLVPCGSHSYLEALSGDPVQLPLFCARGQRALRDVQFDRAMVAFLSCVQQFQEAAAKQEPALCTPYGIRAREGLVEEPGPRGGFYSVRTRGNSEERWARALKLLLTNFKWSLAWVSSRDRRK